MTKQACDCLLLMVALLAMAVHHAGGYHYIASMYAFLAGFALPAVIMGYRK